MLTHKASASADLARSQRRVPVAGHIPTINRPRSLRCVAVAHPSRAIGGASRASAVLHAAAPAAAAARGFEARVSALKAAPVPVVDDQPSENQQKGPVREFLSTIVKGAAVAAVAAALMFGHVSPAEAARSAGRVGGFAGSSAPSRSYGGGGGGYSGGGGGYSRGGSYAPSYGGSYVSPPSFYRGGYSSYGLMGPPVVAPPVVVAPYATGAAVVASPASPVLDALLLMSLAFIAFSAASSALAPGRSGGLLGPDAGAAGGLQLTKIQVGLLAVARDLKRDLDQIAEDADTSSNAGLKELLQEVTLALLRNPQYAEFVSGGKRAVGDSSELERLFNSASLAERSKFTEETLVNVRGGGGVRRARRSARAGPSARPDELIVVTLLVATQGDVKLPKKIGSGDALKAALRSLGGLRSDQVLGVEVLWTPQAEGDYFSRDELTRDYPDMRML